MRNLRMKIRLSANSRWLIAATLVTLLSLAFVFAPGARANAPAAPPVVPPAQETNTDIITNGDLVVEAGRTVNGDAVVFSGDVLVEAGSIINGDLVAMSGDLELEAGARVTGDVILFSGDADIDGEIQGDLALWSGDVELGDDALIGGDVSLLSGDLDSDDDAVISGNVTRGPDFDLPLINSVLGAAGQDVTQLESNDNDRVIQIERTPTERLERGGFVGWLGRSLARLLRAALWVGLLTLGAAVLTSARPSYVRRISGVMQNSLPAAFGLGLIVTLVLGVFFFLFRLTIWLWFIALLPTLVLVALNVIGWAAIGRLVGQRLQKTANFSLGEPASVAVGVTIGAGLIGALGALGLCFTPLSWLLLIVASSVGVGATLLPWAQRLLGNGGAGGSSSTGSGSILTVPDGPTGDAPSGAAAYGASAQPFTEPSVSSESTFVASASSEADSAADSAADSTADSTAELSTPPQQERSMSDEQSPNDITPADTAAAETLGAAPEEVQELESGDDLDEEQAAEVEQQARAAGRTEDDDNTEDDLTRIFGIGQTFDSRLKESGIRTFADLANRSPEEIAEIIGWAPERVERDDLIGQARTLASEGQV